MYNNIYIKVHEVKNSHRVGGGQWLPFPSPTGALAYIYYTYNNITYQYWV